MKHPYKRLLALLTLLVVGMGTLWASGTRDDYANAYFTVESLTDNDTIVFFITSGITPEYMTSVSYSTDGTEWTTVMVDNTNQQITVVLNQGEKVYFKGVGRQCGTSDVTAYCCFRGKAEHMVYGNIMSLLYGDDFASQTAFPEGSGYNFCALFYYDESLVSAENLVLPATTLAPCCYSEMFRGCTKLVSVPALPATTLAEYCHAYMFNQCLALTEAPELPATTLAAQCYMGMFKGCTSLTTAPALPATELAPFCYYKMFDGCVVLTAAPPELPATILPDFCYAYMFRDCNSLTAAPDLHASQLGEACCLCLFDGCTSLTQAPKLPATELSEFCYYGMFSDCLSLTEAPELPATTLGKSCYAWMFFDCYALAKAPELPAPILVDSCYQGMFYRCTSLDEITCLATDISAPGSVENWMLIVGPSGTFYKAPEMNDWPLESGSGVPVGWTVANYDGIDEQQAQVAVYPNPVADKLHITGADIQSVKLFDPQGRLVRTEECDRANQIDLDFQGYARGVYTVSILSKGKAVTRKVVY